MSAVGLALLASASYGSADFLGGLSARRAPVLLVTLVSGLAGLAAIIPVAALVSEFRLSPGAWAAAIAAGLSAAIGLTALYRGLARGPMTVVAPVTALVATMVPVLFEQAINGALLPFPVAAGVLFALVGICLIGGMPDGRGQRSSRRSPLSALGISTLAGMGIAGFYIALERAGTDGGLWPLVVARGASVSLWAMLAFATARTTLRYEKSGIALAAAAGISDTLANSLYLIAVRMGTLSAVVTLSSLYPATTILLARVVLKERVTRGQGLGLACAAVGAIAIGAKDVL